MCGIYFKLCKEINSLEFENFMKLKHRGPNKSVFQCVQNEDYSVIYGFHRLRIVGSIDYHQPFIQNGIYVLCNGEIYNYKSLISNYGLSPKTDSDCEVVLLMYKKYGIQKTLQLLDGEFAFIIYDTTKNVVYCARDPFGVRPLFVNIEKNSTILITSEAKAQCKQCEQLVPGMYYEYTYSNGINRPLEISLIKHMYYEFPKSLSVFSNSKLKEFLEYSVYNRIHNAEKDIGFLLSGGLDSSLVLSIAMKYLPKTKYPIRVFSIGYSNIKNEVYDTPDVKRAIEVVKYLKDKYGNNCIDHHIVSYNHTTAMNVLNKVIYMLESCDITTIRASIPMYILAGYISKLTNVKIVMSGEGSDELFGGYIYFKYAPNSIEFENEKKKLLKQIHLFDGLRADRMISAHGLELRVPFLDKRLVNYVLSIPLNTSSANYDTVEKYLLRNAFDEDYLPSSIIWAQKEAFSDGVGHSWIKNLKDTIEARNSINLLNWKLITLTELELNSEYYASVDSKYLNFDVRKELFLNYFYFKEADIICLQGIDLQMLNVILDIPHYQKNYTKIDNESYIVTMYVEYLQHQTSDICQFKNVNMYLYSINLPFGLICLFNNSNLQNIDLFINVDLNSNENIRNEQYETIVYNINEIKRSFSHETRFRIVVCGDLKTNLFENSEFVDCFGSNTDTTNHKTETRDNFTLVNNFKIIKSEYAFGNYVEYPNQNCPSIYVPLITKLCNVTEKEYYRAICKQNYSTDLVPYLWLPNWISTNDEPSATVLPNYSVKV